MYQTCQVAFFKNCTFVHVVLFTLENRLSLPSGAAGARLRPFCRCSPGPRGMAHVPQKQQLFLQEVHSQALRLQEPAHMQDPPAVQERLGSTAN